MNTETFPKGKTAAKAIIPRVLNQFPPLQNSYRSVLGSRGITPPCAWNKGDGDNAPQRARALTGSRARVLVGLWAQVQAGTPAGAHTRIQTQAHASSCKSVEIEIIPSKIPMRLQYK